MTRRVKIATAARSSARVAASVAARVSTQSGVGGVHSVTHRVSAGPAAVLAAGSRRGGRATHGRDRHGDVGLDGGADAARGRARADRAGRDESAPWPGSPWRCVSSLSNQLGGSLRTSRSVGPCTTAARGREVVDRRAVCTEVGQVGDGARGARAAEELHSNRPSSASRATGRAAHTSGRRPWSPHGGTPAGVAGRASRRGRGSGRARPRPSVRRAAGRRAGTPRWRRDCRTW